MKRTDILAIIKPSMAELPTTCHFNEWKNAHCITVDVDEWFAGCIGSLFYKPNRKILILKDKIIPELPGFVLSTDRFSKNNIYDFWIINTDLSKHTSTHFSYLTSGDQFTITNGGAEKRLASFVLYEPDWKFPQKRRQIIPSYSTNPDYNVDPVLFWQSVYLKFKKNYNV